MKKSLLLTLLLATAFVASAQTKVGGKVTDAQTGEALISVSVFVKGTNTGAFTDLDGKFVVSVSDPNTAVLVFSYTGFKTTELAVEGRTDISFAMGEDVQAIEQVVVVGYGTQRKSDLTGAVGTIKAKDISRIPTASVEQALQGKIAGVYVSPVSGEPGKGAVIRIRGTGTLNNANPLYVVDGMLLDDVSFINPQDIESIEVLKDASATAIYGNRGANGVIIITTKRGSIGKKAIVTFDSYYGSQDLTKKLDLVNASEFAQMYNELTKSKYYENPEALGEGTDWQDVIFRTAPIANVQLGVNGALNKFTYNLSGSYFNQEGVLVNNGYNRTTARFNGEYPITNFLKVGANVAYSYDKSHSVGGGVIGSAYRMPPTLSEKDSTGAFTDPTFFGLALANPAADIFYKSDLSGVQKRFVSTFYASLKFWNNFTFKTSYGIDNKDVLIKSFEPVFKVSASQLNLLARNSRSRSGNNTWLLENTLNYDKEWDMLRLNVLAGQSAQKYREDFFNAVNDTLQPNGAGQRGWSMLSYLFRTNATLLNRYLFTVSLRADGSSRFSQDNRWGYFPSVAIGWNIAQEPILQHQKVFDRLKLRASWGIVGNDKTQLYPSLGFIEDELYAVFGNNQNIQPGATLIRYANPAVRWESASQTDFGFEAAFLNGRLSTEIDWYNRFTYDILSELPIPDYVGSQSAPVVNSAEVRNRGWDITLGWRETRGKITYNIGTIVSTLNNEVTKINQGKSEIFAAQNGQGDFATRTVVGLPIGAFYGYQVAGVFQNQAELNKYPKIGTEKPGDLRFADLNGDSVINNKDRTYLGSPIPTLTYGFNLGIEAYGFDLALDFFGVKGNKVVNSKVASRFGVYNWERKFYENRWTGDTSVIATAPRVTNGGQNYRMSSFLVEDGSFFRLRSIVIGYSLPRALLSKLHLTRLRVYASGTNLWTKQAYSGYSPEFPNNSVFEAGIDNGSYPITKTLLFGLNVTF